MRRILRPELLDELDPSDPLAVGSRKDLRRLNRQMRSALLFTRTLARIYPGPAPRAIVELGAGDGTLLLDVARRLGTKWHGVEAVLLDQRDLVRDETRREFERLGWKVRSLCLDVFKWIKEPNARPDLVLANLFLHHFTAPQLRDIFSSLASRTNVFLALEPRRCMRFMAVTRLLWLYGCNRVTRHDAQLSVQAGFRDGEMTLCWPIGPEWRVTEGRAGWFSHQFLAERQQQEATREQTVR